MCVGPIDRCNSTGNCMTYGQIDVLTDTWMPDRPTVPPRCPKGHMDGHVTILMDMQTARHTRIPINPPYACPTRQMQLCLHLNVSNFPYLQLPSYY